MRRLHFLTITTLAVGCCAQEPVATPLVFREDFRDVRAHTPAEARDLTCEFLGFERLGAGAGRVKLSFHPNVANDPHYLWNGDCPGPVLLAFPFRHSLDLSAGDRCVRLRSKNVGGAALHITVRCGSRWFALDTPVPQHAEWSTNTMPLRTTKWRVLQPKRARITRRTAEPDWSRVDALGFLAPKRGGGSAQCIRLDWFELRSSSAQRISSKRTDDAPTPHDADAAWPADTAWPIGAAVRQQSSTGEPFVERDAPFVRTALLAGTESAPNRTRRGIVVPCNHGVWACFDPDLLRWSAFWHAADGSSPFSLESMAAVSYPDRKAKASRIPRFVGSLLMRQAEQPGASVGATPIDDPRVARLSDGRTPVGPLPTTAGRYEALQVAGSATTIEYRVGAVQLRESIFAQAANCIVRTIDVAANTETVCLVLTSGTGNVDGTHVEIRDGGLAHIHATGDALDLFSEEGRGTWLRLAPGAARAIRVTYSASATTPPATAAPPHPGGARHPVGASFPPARAKRVRTRLAGERQGPLSVRDLPLPARSNDERRVRPTDVAFQRDGTAFVTTLDGDIWRIDAIESSRPSWRRVAAGLFESTNIEIDDADRIFVLGRDQVTELIDIDQDGTIDRYRNATDGFWQTLNTRDYAMSMAIEPDGAFLIAKGGIDNSSGSYPEHTSHRGAVIRVRQNGEAQVLADGLRLPYVGRRSDGMLFASDQQGNWVPSTPIVRIDDRVQSYGFAPTRHRGGSEIAAPLLWFPYQSNRSGAGFAELDPRAFPSLHDRFAHIAWDGRLFLLATPSDGMAFGWRLPLQFRFPSLNAASHPLTGTLYVAGLGISGYLPMTERLAGLAAVRESGKLTAPTRFDVEPQSISVSFREPVPTDVAIEVASLRFWNIERSSRYGSGHTRWDGKPGEHAIQPTSAALDASRRRLTIGIRTAYCASIVALHLQVRPRHGTDYALELFGTPAHLPAPDPQRLAGIAAPPTQAVKPGRANKGKQLFERYACSGCHSLTADKLVGPPLNGIGTRHRGVAGQAHLRQSLLEPAKVVARGYPASMPSYSGVIPPQDIEHIVAFLQTLK
ncbi:MAG: DUF6797 domain-containing protein [Planctomycetota bacterium]